jgi:MFS family permease
MTHSYSDQPAIRRATLVLLLTQSVASAALLTSTTVNPLVMARLSGQEALAGLPSALMLAGASLAAYPAGHMMGRIGRRYGLTVGGVVALLGALLSGFSVLTGQWLPFLLGLMVLGAGRSTLDQGRYAAAEINPPEHRARAMSIVIFGGTVGAILGPALVAPSGSLFSQLGATQLAGPFFTTSAMLIVVVAIVWLLLPRHLRAIAQRVAAIAAVTGVAEGAGTAAISTTAPQADTEPTATRVAHLLRTPLARIAILTMTTAQATMVMMMAIISLHMSHHQHGLGDISLVTSAHVLGMYAFSPFIGQLADRLGRRVMIGVSALLIGLGCVLAPLSIQTPWIALALFLVGLGWSGAYISGSTLLTDVIAAPNRPRLQGASDTLVNIASAIGSLSSGVLLQLFGFNVLSLISCAVALIPLLALLFSRPAPLREPATVAR